MSCDILIVDDEADICDLVGGILSDDGYRVRTAQDSITALNAIAAKQPNLVILDVWLGDGAKDGLKILETIKRDHPHVPVVMMSGHSTVETAVTAIKLGAYDFIEKPFQTEKLLVTVTRAIETARLKVENNELKVRAPSFCSIIGSSSVVQNVKQIIDSAAPTSMRMFIHGPIGSDRSAVARYIHDHSLVGGPFYAINCAAFNQSQLDAEIFGLEIIAKNDNSPRKIGLLEHANGGTLFIDNITALSSSQQRKLANFLQAKSFQRVGGIFPICVDVRILAGSCFSREEILDDGATAEPENETAISANANANANAGAAAVAPFITNSQKSAQSDEQDFRCKILSDLYYRLSSMFVCLPALSERVQDIALLTKRFSSMIALAQNVPQKNFSPEAIAVFETYPWPGDIQQLKNVIEWVLIMHASRADDTIKVEDLPPEIVEGNTFAKAWQARAAHFASMPMKEARDAFERDYLASQLRRFNWNVSQTARFIGIDRASLHRKLKSIGLGVTSGEEDAPHDILKVAK